jgi:carbon storage regulator CsrA
VLVLTRKRGETIIIGEPPNQITISIRSIVNRQKVSVGVDAPRSIPITRGEDPGRAGNKEGGDHATDSTPTDPRPGPRS